MTWRELSLITLLLAACCTFSCRKESDLDLLIKPEWNPKIALPLLNDDLDMSSIVNSKSTSLETDPSSVIKFVYNAELSSQLGGQIIEFVDQFILLNGSSGFVNYPFFYGENLTNVYLKSGSLSYQFSNTVTEAVTVNFTVPYAKKAGVPLSETFIVPSTGTTFQTGTISLENYIFDLSQTAGINEFEIEYSVIQNSDLTDVTSSYPIEMEFLDFNFELIEGYIGEFEMGIETDTIFLDFFKNWVSGVATITDPKVKLSVQSTYGFPITLELLSVSGSNNNGVVIPLSTTAIVGAPFIPVFPDITQIGETINSIYFMDSSNSNIKNFISISPSEISISLKLSANLGADPSDYNFLMDNSEIKTNVSVELPLHGNLNKVFLIDTLNIEPTSIVGLDKIRDARFRIEADNGFPLSLALQIKLLDENFDLIDSLLKSDPIILEAAVVDANGVATNTSSKISYADISLDPLSSKKIRHLEVSALLHSVESPDEDIKITEHDKLHIKLGVISTLDLLP